MICQQNMTCSDANHTVHYEFEYFETEAGFDKLFVNEVIYDGASIPTNEWIDSFASKVDLIFSSDFMTTKRGFKMNLKCDVSTQTGTTSTSISSIQNSTAGAKNECVFEDYGNSALFDTGSPYRNDMRQGFHVIKAHWPGQTI